MRNKKIIFKGKNLSLFLKKIGREKKKIEAEIIQFPQSVGIIAFSKKGEILLIKQFRFPLEKEIWEIPAGKVKRKEKPIVAAKRELEEETGFKARKWKKLFSLYLAPGYSTEKMIFFEARELERGKQEKEEDELITKVGVFSLSKNEKNDSPGEDRGCKNFSFFSLLFLWKNWFLTTLFGAVK